MPVGTRARSPGSSTTSTVVTRSHPASPGCAYAGSGTPGSRRVTATSSTRFPSSCVVDRRTDSTGRNVLAVTTYDERWRVPWYWWPAGLGLATLVAAELHSGAPGSRAVLPYAVLLPLTALLLAVGSRGRIRVQDGVLHVPGARIPVHLLADRRVLDRESLRRQAGPMADRNAFLVSRPWLHT